MRRVGLVAVSALVLLSQLTLLPAVRPLGVVPNAVLCLVALVGLEGTASKALVLAVIGGLVIDMGSGANFGLWTGILVLEALVAGLLHRAGVELAGAVMPVLMVLAGTLAMNAIILISLAGTVARWQWGLLLVHLGVQLGLNIVLTLLLRPPVRWLVRTPSASPLIG